MIELEPRPLRKKSVFSGKNPYKIEVMITSLIEVLELPNFGHLTTFTMYFEAKDETLLVTS